MRILVTLSPLMYREAIARSLCQHRPDFEIRLASPEAIEEEIKGFGPHLLLRDDKDGLDPEELADVPFWVEICYSDTMDARMGLGGRMERARDISTEILLRVADEAAARARGA